MIILNLRGKGDRLNYFKNKDLKKLSFHLSTRSAYRYFEKIKLPLKVGNYRIFYLN